MYLAVLDIRTLKDGAHNFYDVAGKSARIAKDNAITKYHSVISDFGEDDTIYEIWVYDENGAFVERAIG